MTIYYVGEDSGADWVEKWGLGCGILRILATTTKHGLFVYGPIRLMNIYITIELTNLHRFSFSPQDHRDVLYLYSVPLLFMCL